MSGDSGPGDASAVALAWVLGGSVSLAAAGNAIAQADIRIDVTGSNIRRLEGEGALPVQVLNRQDIERTGAQSAADLLQYVSAANSAGATGIVNVVGATTFSASIPSLRGLGGQATLVLVNGKRLSQYSGEVQAVYGVNLDAIPFSAIERVEILKDGASAVYGSDAIAGVINFILRQDFTGIETSAYGGWPTRDGSGDVWNVKATGGFGDLAKDKYNLFVTAYYQKADPVFQNQRDFANTSVIPSIGLDGTSGNTFPAFVSTGNIGNPSFPNCEPSIPVGTRCRYDTARIDGVNSIPEAETTSFYGSFRYQFNPTAQFYATLAWTSQEVRNVIQPVPISDQFFYGPTGEISSAVTLPPGSPYYPTAQAIAAGVNGQLLNYRYRCVECGNRDATDKNDQWQGVVGLKGVAWGLDYDIDFAYSQSETKQTINGGYPDLTLAIPLLSSGNVNPFGPNPPAITAAIQATNFQGESFNAEATGWVFEGKAFRDLVNLPAGALVGAFGFQIGDQTLKQNPSPILAQGNILGFGGNFLPIDVSRDWWALFAEFNIPLVRTLELNAAVRYDHYSDFGGTTNPKFALRWNPTREILVRASWGTGFIAPSLTQLYGASTRGLTIPGLSDPLRCPTTGDSNDCDTQFPVTFAGNARLQPQTASQWMLGIVLEPAPGSSIAFDYFSIDTDNLFRNGISTSAILADQDQYGYLVTRASPAPPYPTLPGRIININQSFINLGNVKIAGIDVDVQARSPQTALGRFQFGLTGSYYTKYDVQQTDGSYAGFVSKQQFAANTGVTPRYRQYATLTWTYGPWSATLGNVYQSGYIDWGTDANGETRRVSSMSLWDLSTTYTGFKRWQFVLGVKNLFDTSPPVSNQQVAFQSGYDPSYYDARARLVYGTTTYSFN